MLRHHQPISSSVLKGMLAWGLGAAPPLLCQAQAPLACPAVSYGPVQTAAPPLKADGRYFKDTAGRTVLLRGVNATGDAKVPPFMPLTSGELLDPLAKAGLNVVRLLFNWEAFEPARCQYNETYMDYYEQVVRWAAQRSLYVIVDFHQDAYSRFTMAGCGEGFPAWSIVSSVKQDVPTNDGRCKGWGTRMVLYQSHHDAWQGFHADTEGALTRYTDMVRFVAERMGKHPNVIGYDTMNEPWGNPTEMLAMYEKTGAAIRDRHPGAILFVSPHAAVSLGYINDNVAKPSFGNAAYSPHYYDTSLMSLRRWQGFAPATPLGRMLARANSRQAPMLLGEFGAPVDAQRADEYLEAIYTWLDDEFISGTQWSYTPGWTPQGKDGWNLEDFSVYANGQWRKPLFTSRPYPQKTSGEPVKFKRTATGLTYSWRHEPWAGATEIFLPEGYEKGKTLKVSPFTLRCSQSGRLLKCQGGLLRSNASVSLMSPSPN